MIIGVDYHQSFQQMPLAQVQMATRAGYDIWMSISPRQAGISTSIRLP